MELLDWAVSLLGCGLWSDLFLLASHSSLLEWERSLCAIASGRRTTLWFYRNAPLKDCLESQERLDSSSARTVKDYGNFFWWTVRCIKWHHTSMGARETSLKVCL